MKTNVSSLLLFLAVTPVLTGCERGGMLIGSGLYALAFVMVMLSSVLYISVKKCGWKGMKDLNLFCSWIGWYMLFLQALLILIFVV